jgi:hypothetical protein
MNETRGVPTDLGQWVGARNPSLDEVASKILEIKESVLRESQHLDTENFTCVHPVDIEQIFDLYDQLFFENGCRNLLSDTPLSFRLSRRMTRSGGKTSRREIRDFIGKVVNKEYEVAVSETLLFQAFEGNHRPVVICGIECENRLEALQRIMEHEITHLVELLIWSKSSCSATRFQSIANRWVWSIPPSDVRAALIGEKTVDRIGYPRLSIYIKALCNRRLQRAIAAPSLKRLLQMLQGITECGGIGGVDLSFSVQYCRKLSLQ